MGNVLRVAVIVASTGVFSMHADAESLSPRHEAGGKLLLVTSCDTDYDVGHQSQ